MLSSADKTHSMLESMSLWGHVDVFHQDNLPKTLKRCLPFSVKHLQPRRFVLEQQAAHDSDTGRTASAWTAVRID